MYWAAMAEAGMEQGDPDKIKVVGTPIEQCQYHFKPHDRMVKPYNLGKKAGAHIKAELKSPARLCPPLKEDYYVSVFHRNAAASPRCKAFKSCRS
jgi:hypothetical protein